MERYQFDSVTFAALEKLRTPLAIYQFLEKRVVTILLSDGFCDLFEFDDKEEAYYMMDHDMYEATHPDDKARIADEAFRFATEGGKYEVVYRTKTRNRDAYKIIHSMGEHVFTDDGVRLAYIWYTDEGNYTEGQSDSNNNLSAVFRKALHEESIIKANHYDFLTGLPNMSYFFEVADAWRNSHIRSGGVAALLYMDLCGMKFFNRKYGFSEGDKLLRNFADRIKERFSNENCSRFGSDHFCVITDAAGVEDKLRELFLSFIANSKSITLPVRVGIFLDKTAELDISVECDRAKFACDTMRNTYLSNFRYFNMDMLEEAESRQYIIDNIDTAVEKRWIQVYYQPLIRAANGMVCGVEALARWMDPVKGMLTPDEFIPALEEARLIYKLDLSVVELTLEKIKRQKEAGEDIIPVSVNLSRIDFDVCDIIEEIRRRVDAAEIPRDKFNIEITESAIGIGMGFMQEQVDRFRALGFRVWMDDFGSGYSSLDMLQSSHFDLIKFDMHFMREFRNGEKSKIILSEMIKLAIALGIDTVCEGVETEDQADFLREVGCTMMQGYYFSRPIPFEDFCTLSKKGIRICLENPDESDYYAAVGRINLYDLAIVSSEEEAFKNYFNTLPMAIIESTNESFRLLRCNNSYRTFMRRLPDGELMLGEPHRYANNEDRPGAGFLQALHNCGENGSNLLLDEELSNGVVAHTFLKRVAVNPVTDTRAVAVAILAVHDVKTMPMSFTHIARALFDDYIAFYYVNLQTEAFVEYWFNNKAGVLGVERHGENFFAASRQDAERLIFAEDRAAFTAAFTKEKILAAIRERGSFALGYRLLIDGKPVYVNLRAVQTRVDDNHIIIGVNNVDVQMRQMDTQERTRQERITFSRVAALSSDFICIYTVDPETSAFSEYSTSDPYAVLDTDQSGEDFFESGHRVGKRIIHPDDCPAFCSALTRENMLRGIQNDGVFTLDYRLLLNGSYTPVRLKAVMIEEKDGPQLIVGVTYADAHTEV